MGKKVLINMLQTIVKVLVIGVAVVILYNVARYAFDSTYKIMSKTPSDDIIVKNIDITIPKGASTGQIAKILEENGLINNTYYFRFYAKISGQDGSFQYGDYTLNTGMTEEEIADILLTEGTKRETLKFVIPEGYTIEQIAKKLSKEGICKESEFLDAVNNVAYGYRFIEQIPDRNLKLQGYLFPATYEIYKDSTAQDIVSTMLKKFDQVFKSEYYDRAEALGFTVDQVLTIASIIEKEVKVGDERNLVSSVIYNRLDIEMPLQMCSTVMYTLDKPKDRLLYRDLEIDSPYNTYIYSGLPVGPISNPGAASIEAALYPSDTDYLYFVLVNENTGEHEFNTSLDAHNRAKNKYNQEF